jgi:hypothetical protein
MDEKLQYLISQLQESLNRIPEEQISAMLRQVQEEALNEVKEMLKQNMVHAILKQVLARAPINATQLPDCDPPFDEGSDLVQDRPQIEELNPSSTVLPPVAVSRVLSEQPDPDIQAEIEAIRRKIVENEQLLSQIKTPPTQAAKATPETADEPTSAVNPPDSEEDHKEHLYGYYVYGIVEEDHPLEKFSEQGIDPAFPVYGLPHQAVKALVSQVSLQEFGQETLEANLSDPHWLEEKVRAHQAVLETASADGSLIPMKFCTIYLSEKSIQQMLIDYSVEFVETLDRLKGKQEWGVKVYCDREMLSRHVEESDEKVKMLQTEVTRKPSGVAYFARKKLEETVEEEAERVSDMRAQNSHDRLADCAVDSRVTSLLSKEVTGRADEMVLNGAYLVAAENMADFQTEFESLENENGSFGFHYELTGPWPPYNFVAIGLEDNPATVDGAVDE